MDSTENDDLFQLLALIQLSFQEQEADAGQEMQWWVINHQLFARRQGQVVAGRMQQKTICKYSRAKTGDAGFGHVT